MVREFKPARRRMDFRKRLRRKRCRFCVDKSEIDYKDSNLLRSFISERGKILSGRITGVCARHQHKVSQAIKRARILAFLPFSNV